MYNQREAIKSSIEFYNKLEKAVEEVMKNNNLEVAAEKYELPSKALGMYVAIKKRKMNIPTIKMRSKKR